MTLLVTEVDFRPKCVLLPARSMRTLDSTGNTEFTCTDEAPVGDGVGVGVEEMLQQFKSKENARRRGGVLLPTHHPRRQLDFDLCSSLSDSGFEALREAPGFDFSCFVKKIMIQTLACICHRARNVKEVLGFMQHLLGEP